MARWVAELGTTCLLYKCDLSRFFRQIPTCPKDWCLLGMHWQNLLYFDKFFPMGLRSAAFCCQRVTNAVVYIHKSYDYWSINYLDDFGSAEAEYKAWQSFWCLRQILTSVGIQEAEEKVCPPSPQMEFLSNIVDARNMMLEVSEQRMEQIQNELDNWLVIDRATRKQLESIIGKLSFIANCVWAGRVFIARLINLLTGFLKVGKYTIPTETKKDFIWWKRFLKDYNGVSILWLQDTLTADVLLATDLSLVGAGAVCANEYFHVKYPQQILEKFSNIAHLEMLAIILAIKLWGDTVSGKVVHLSCDNQACVEVINTGRASDRKLQECLRELVMLVAKKQAWLKLVYVSTTKNTLPDLLSH